MPGHRPAAPGAHALNSGLALNASLETIQWSGAGSCPQIGFEAAGSSGIRPMTGVFASFYMVIDEQTSILYAACSHGLGCRAVFGVKVQSTA